MHAITQLSAELLKAFDDKQYTTGVFLDLSKAFDTINHNNNTKIRTLWGSGCGLKSGSGTTSVVGNNMYILMEIIQTNRM